MIDPLSPRGRGFKTRKGGTNHAIHQDIESFHVEVGGRR